MLDRRSLAGAALVLVVALGAAAIAVVAYHAGASEGPGAPEATRHYWGGYYGGWGPGFFIFRLFFAVLFFFVIFALLRVLFFGPRHWHRDGWTGRWERDRQAFEDWHRRAHEQGGPGASTPPQASSPGQ